MLNKLRSLVKRDESSEGLVRANLNAVAIPPEYQDDAPPGLQSAIQPQHTIAETAGIASLHPETMDEQPLHSTVVEASEEHGLKQRPNLYKSLLGKKENAQPTKPSIITSEDDRMGGQASLAASLRDQTGPGHQEIQNLAEHYKGRSRRLAAARDLSSTTDAMERADVILDHQLMDIDSI